MNSEQTALEDTLRAFQKSILAVPEVLVATSVSLQRTESVTEDFAPPHVSHALRLGLYRKHILQRLVRTLRSLLPRTTACLGAAYEDQVSQFFSAGQTHSPYLREAAFEFVAWAAPHWSADSKQPAYLMDLARYELALLEVACAAADRPDTDELPLTIDRGVQLSRAARLYHFTFAVHESPTPSAPTPTTLLGYRDHEQLVQMLALYPVAAAILEALLNQATRREAVVQACQTFALPIDDTILADTAQLLANLAEQGVVLGALPHESAKKDLLINSGPRPPA